MIDCGVFQFDDVNVNIDGYNVIINGVFVRGYVIDECTITFCVGCVSNIKPYDVLVPSVIANGPTTFSLYSNPPLLSCLAIVI